jgi:hypothetical protein
MGTIEGYTKAVEAYLTKPSDPFWKTSIGVEVDRSSVGLFSKFENGVFQKSPLDQWLPLAALPKTDDRILRLL